MAAKVKRCAFCEVLFIPKSHSQRYCSVACRDSAQRIRRPRKPPKPPKPDPVAEIEAKFAAQAEREHKARLEAAPVDYLNWGQTIWARNPEGWAVTFIHSQHGRPLDHLRPPPGVHIKDLDLVILATPEGTSYGLAYTHEDASVGVVWLHLEPIPEIGPKPDMAAVKAAFRVGTPLPTFTKEPTTNGLPANT